VRHVTKSFAGFTTTVMPSIATWSSTYSMLLAAHARPSASSSALIGRDASLMSVSSLQNFTKPPPVPLSATATWMPEFAVWKSSATSSVIGKTVLEPSTVTLPLPAPPPVLGGATDAPLALLGLAVGLLPPQAARTSAPARAAAPSRDVRLMVTRWFLQVPRVWGVAIQLSLIAG